MSKAHFVAIAAAFRSVRNKYTSPKCRAALDTAIEAIAEVCAMFNEKFDQEVFYKAAGHSDFTG